MKDLVEEGDYFKSTHLGLDTEYNVQIVDQKK
jgi:hypothetical protein